MRIAKTSIALLAIQVILVSSVAVKYLYQRATCPRVWTRTVMYDPNLVMRGRYLSMQLIVDGCQSTLPSAKQAIYPRSIEGLPRGATYTVTPTGGQAVQFDAKLAVKENRLVAIRVLESDQSGRGQSVVAPSLLPCDQMRLNDPVDFYISEHAVSPLPVKTGQELWVEVTVPPKGPPRPIQIALKENGQWKPLAFQ